jgi:hypothetical protein
LLRSILKDKGDNSSTQVRLQHIPELRPPDLDDYLQEQPFRDTGQHSSAAVDQVDPNSAIDDLSSMMWKMSIGPGGEPSFTGPSGNFFLDAPSEVPDLGMPRAVEPHLHALELIEEDTKDYFLRLFIDHVNPVYQFVDSSRLHTDEMRHALTGSANDFMMSAVYAAGICYASRQTFSVLGDTYASHAEDLMMQCCRDCPSLVVIQGLIILGWRELSLGREHTAWMYNCMCKRRLNRTLR